MVKMIKVTGKNKGDVKLYALSTCVWCKKTKGLLDSLGVEYSFVDVDLLQDTDLEDIKKEINKWNPSGSFPTTIINSKDCIVGFNEDKIRDILK